MMSDDKPPKQDDKQLFRQQMQDVKPLQHDRAELEKPRPAARPRQTELNEQSVLVDMMSDEYEVAEVETGEELFFARPGLQTKVLRKLKRGQFRLAAELDLHGLNVEAARTAVAQFLTQCQLEDRRCVRIIHGKGLSSKHKGPVIKQMVNRWLRQRKEVLAFSSALPRDGGTGAVYVLLKKAGK